MWMCVLYYKIICVRLRDHKVRRSLHFSDDSFFVVWSLCLAKCMRCQPQVYFVVKWKCRIENNMKEYEVRKVLKIESL